MYQVRNWNNKEVQRLFLQKLAQDLRIKTPNEWGKVSTRQVLALGGSSLLKNIYQGSLFKALKSCFPGTNPQIVTHLRNGLEKGMV